MHSSSASGMPWLPEVKVKEVPVGIPIVEVRVPFILVMVDNPVVILVTLVHHWPLVPPSPTSCPSSFTGLRLFSLATLERWEPHAIVSLSWDAVVQT